MPKDTLFWFKSPVGTFWIAPQHGRPGRVLLRLQDDHYRADAWHCNGKLTDPDGQSGGDAGPSKLIGLVVGNGGVSLSYYKEIGDRLSEGVDYKASRWACAHTHICNDYQAFAMIHGVVFAFGGEVKSTKKCGHRGG